MDEIYVCELCNRRVNSITKHHLIPVAKGGKHHGTADLCATCHNQIHALYSNKELGARLFTIERLKTQERVQRYLRFLEKQQGEVPIKIKRSKIARCKTK